MTATATTRTATIGYITGPPLKNVSNIELPLAQSGMGRPPDAATSAANIGAKLAINVTI